MSLIARGVIAAAAFLTFSTLAFAQAVPTPPLFDLPAALASAEPAQGGRAQTDRFALGVRVEYWEVDELEVVGSDNAFGLSEDAVERGLEIRQFHSAALLQGDYTHSFSKSYVRGHAGLGWERMGTIFETDASSIFGLDEFDDVFDSDLVWEIGGAFGYQFDRTTDGVLSVLFRGGESSVDRPGGEEIEYTYTMLRIAGEVGYAPNETARLFLQVRFTLYQAEWEFSDPNPEITYELEFDQPVGISIGVDLLTKDVGPVGRIEIQFLDVLGFVASTGWRF